MGYVKERKKMVEISDSSLIGCSLPDIIMHLVCMNRTLCRLQKYILQELIILLVMVNLLTNWEGKLNIRAMRKDVTRKGRWVIWNLRFTWPMNMEVWIKLSRKIQERKLEP